MENCLVKKLKAVINNPNLPYIETMQQFTLDAIAASGNNSMTDAQKWALNHFFYQIGAINSGNIFTKLKAIYLPVISADLQHTLINYKNNNNDGGSFNNMSFTDKGLVSTTSGNVYYSYVWLDPLTYTSLSLVLVRKNNFGGTYSWESGGNATGGTCKIQDSCNIVLDNNTNASYVISNVPSDARASVLSLNSVSDNNLNAVYMNSGSNIVKVSSTIKTSPAFVDNINVRGQIKGKLTQGSPTRVSIVGNGLTDNEAKVLLEAVMELESAFV